MIVVEVEQAAKDKLAAAYKSAPKLRVRDAMISDCGISFVLEQYFASQRKWVEVGRFSVAMGD
jgi:hypothetical protein